MSCVSRSLNSRSSKLSSKSAASSAFKSKVEQAILKSTEPICFNETKEIIANKERGIFLNRCEVCLWKGDLPIQEYPINEDSCPEIVNKKSCKKIEYNQEIAIRYLKPPAAPEPGPILIKTEPNKPTAPAPPVIIRQQPPRPCTPEPLVIREAPPCPPPCIPQQVITISGKPLPPPPRKVVVERLAPMPPKPQPIIVERWMPYDQNQKRRVIYQCPSPDPIVSKPKNIIVQWEQPDVCVKKDIKHLGVVCANPCEYIQKYGSCIKQSCDLPQFVKDIPPQCGVELAANKPTDQCPVFELCGDVCALNDPQIDLEKEGLAAYKCQVREKCGCPPPPSPPPPKPCPPQCDPCADFDPDCCPPECPSTEQPCPSEGILSCPGSPAPSPKRSSPRRSGLVNSSSAMYGSASSGDISVYGASASGNVYGSGSGLNSGYTSNPMYGSQQQQQYSSSGFGSTTLYGSSGIGSFSLEAGSYTPLSFNY